MVKYKEWDVVDEMPEGWIVMPATPTPVHWGIPICNGKSILSGQREKALLRTFDGMKSLGCDARTYQLPQRLKRDKTLE